MGRGHGEGDGGGPKREKGKGGAALYFDAAWRAVFLEALHECCHLGRAAAAAGVSTSTVYSHRNRDAQFCAKMEEALADGAGRMRQEMLDRDIEAAAYGPAQDAAGRTNSGLAARLRAIEGDAAQRPSRALPRREMERLLLEHIERLSRRLGRGQ